MIDVEIDVKFVELGLILFELVVLVVVYVLVVVVGGFVYVLG